MLGLVTYCWRVSTRSSPSCSSSDQSCTDVVVVEVEDADEDVAWPWSWLAALVSALLVVGGDGEADDDAGCLTFCFLASSHFRLSSICFLILSGIKSINN